MSSVDNLQYIHFLVAQPGLYQLLVTEPAAIGSGETYSLAWNSAAVPEPGTLVLLGTGMALFFWRQRLRQQRGKR